MAVLIKEGRKVELDDESPIKDAAEELGIPFGCNNGICRTCEVEVVKGMENLSEKTEKEEEHFLEQGKRLCCQCKIKKGEVEIKSNF